MLIAYLDDSGTSPTNKVALVAGYLSSGKLWEEFKEKWHTLLDAYGIKTLHRVELEAFQGEFKDWNNHRRTEFLKKAHKIIRRFTYTAIGSAIVKADFDEVIPKGDFIRTFAGVYGWCAHACIVALLDWRQRHNYKDEIQIVFEAGTQGQGQVDTMLRELSKTSSWQEKEKWPVSGWTFQNKSVIPLQAADLVAYEYYRVAEKALIRKQRLGFRKSALDLFRKEEATYSFREFDKRAFTLWAQRWNERVESMKKGSV
jgi:hypothetical protein